jgi:hypothetical protein
MRTSLFWLVPAQPVRERAKNIAIKEEISFLIFHVLSPKGMEQLPFATLFV